MHKFFKSGLANLGGFFGFLPWLFLFFIPAIAMRVWAEEKKSGTEELLMTMPVKDHEVVIGKYLAALLLVAFAIALTFPLPMVLKHFVYEKTPIDWGPIWGGYLGSFLLCGAYLAITCATSAMTRNQVVSFILSLVICLVLALIGIPKATELFTQIFRDNTGLVTAIASLSVVTHFENFQRGVIDLRDVLFFVSVIGFALFLTGVIIRNHRA